MRILDKDRNYIIEDGVLKLPLGAAGYQGYALTDAEHVGLADIAWRISNGYVMGFKNGKNVRLHRLVMDAKPGEVVDHISHDLLDNRSSNLRICTTAENMRNIKKDKLKGVSFYKRDSKWSAYITFDYKKIHLGYFETAEQAAKRYDEKAKELYGEFACLNFV